MFRKNGHFPNLSGWNASNHWYGETTEWTTRLCKCLQIIPTSVFQMMYISPYQPFEKRFPPGATGRFHDHFGNLNGRWSWEDPKDVLLYGCDLEEYFFCWWFRNAANRPVEVGIVYGEYLLAVGGCGWEMLSRCRGVMWSCGDLSLLVVLVPWKQFARMPTGFLTGGSIGIWQS